MKTIVAGSRTITDYESVCEAIKESGFEVTEIVSGGARGVDRLGERFSKDQDIELVVMRADWYKHGKAAGPIRNNQMADYADALVAVYDGHSSGTAHMIESARQRGLKVFVKVVKDTSEDSGNESLAEWQW